MSRKRRAKSGINYINEAVFDLHFTDKVTVLRGQYNELHIVNCYIHEIDFEVDCRFEKIVFKNSFIKNINLNGFLVAVNSIEFHDCKIKNLKIHDFHDLNINLTGCFVKSIIHSCVRSHIYIIDTSFSKLKTDGEDNYLTLLGTEGRHNSKSLILSGTIQYLHITECKINSLQFRNSKLVHELKTYNSIVNEIVFKSEFDPIVIPDIEFNSTDIHSLDYLDLIQFSKISFNSVWKKSRVEAVNIYHVNSWDSIEFYGYDIGTLDIGDLTTKSNSNKLSIRNGTIYNLSIRNCILNSTLISQINLHNATVTIDSSSLVNIELHSIIWQKNYSIEESNVYSDLVDHKETYRQLKVLALKMNNKIDANLFQNNELNIYYKLLTITTFCLNRFPSWLDYAPTKFPKSLFNIPLSILYFIYIFVTPLIFVIGKRNMMKIYSIVDTVNELRYPIKTRTSWMDKIIAYKKSETHNSKSKFNDFTDWILLHTNKLFSNFGQSFVRPFCWLIGLHLLLFLWLLLEKGFHTNITLNLNQIDWSATYSGLRLFLTLINPVHSGTIEYSDQQLNVIGLPVDILMRISSAYFIYYFLKATRKMHYTSNV